MKNGGEILDTVKKLAKHYHTNFIAGSIVRKVGNKIYNSSFALNREGEVIGIYDKIHLLTILVDKKALNPHQAAKFAV